MDSKKKLSIVNTAKHYITLNEIYRSTQLNSVLVKLHLNLVEHVDGVRKLDLFFYAFQRISFLPKQPNATLT